MNDTPPILTREHLRRAGACAAALKTFAELFPHGAPLTPDAMQRAIDGKLPVDWCARLMASAAYAEYLRMKTQAYQEFDRVQGAADAEFQRACEVAREDLRAREEAYAEYQRVCGEAEVELQRARGEALLRGLRATFRRRGTLT